MSAFFNAADRSSIKLSVIGDEANWSIESLEIDSNFFGVSFRLRGITVLFSHGSLMQKIHGNAPETG